MSWQYTTKASLICLRKESSVAALPFPPDQGRGYSQLNTARRYKRHKV